MFPQQDIDGPGTTDLDVAKAIVECFSIMSQTTYDLIVSTKCMCYIFVSMLYAWEFQLVVHIC